MPNTFNLIITGGSPGNGKLRINDGGHTRATAGDKIIWEIASNPQVVAILDIEPKEGSDKVFSAGPTRVSDIKWEATINPNISSACTVFNYSIRWRATNGHTPTHDPIISIKPSTSLISLFLGPLLGVILGAVGGIIYRRMAVAKLKNENKSLKDENERLRLNESKNESQ